MLFRSTYIQYPSGTIHCGDTLTVTAAYEKQLESFTDLRSVEEAAYIEDYLTRKYSGVDAADLPLLTA